MVNNFSLQIDVPFFNLYEHILFEDRSMLLLYLLAFIKIFQLLALQFAIGSLMDDYLGKLQIPLNFYIPFTLRYFVNCNNFTITATLKEYNI